ncbi:hypothetical protein Gpo141_00011744 [Globisporangium polare]
MMVTTMRLHAPRSSRRGGLLALALLCLLSAVHGLFFYVHKENHRCFLVDIPAKTTLRAEYESPDTTDTMKTVLAFYAPNPVADKENVLVKKEVTSDKGSMSVTSTDNGDHWVCVSLDSAEFALPDGAKMRFTLKIAMGASSQEYQDLAKKSHMDDLHLEILKLCDRVGAIQRSQDYAKEKSMLLQTAIESNNDKASWVSVIQIGLLLVTGVYQAKYLQKYFHKKKLV